LGFNSLEEERVLKAVETLKIRSRTIREMAEGSLFYFNKKILYEEKGDKKFLKSEILDLIEEIRERLEKIKVFEIKNLEDVFSNFLQEKDIKLGKIAQPMRVALTGKTVSPGIFEIMEVLGKEDTIERLDNAILHIKGKSKK
jgi:glutamyl-tRNA synthetase